MQLKSIQSYVLSLLLVGSLSACGGDGDTPTPPSASASATSAEGLWTGTTDTNQTVKALVVDDGVYWALYSDARNPSIPAGLVQGYSTSQNGSFTSSDAIDFNLKNGVLKATINGNYAMKQSLNGTISYENNTQPQETFTTTYDSDYESAPDINVVAGRYVGIVIAGETVTVDVFTNKTISGFSNTGCTFNGSFSPRTHGNVYDVSVTFGNQTACSNRNETVNGIGFVMDNNVGTKTLYSAALNSTKTDGFVFIGTK